MIIAVDVLGMVERVFPAEDYVSKAGKELRRQRVVLFDQSASGFSVTLYADRVFFSIFQFFHATRVAAGPIWKV